MVDRPLIKLTLLIIAALCLPGGLVALGVAAEPWVYGPLIGLGTLAGLARELPGAVEAVRANRRTKSDNRFNREMAQLSLFAYRSASDARLDEDDVSVFLAKRYGRNLVSLFGKSYPATILWKSPTLDARPDSILGALDKTPPEPLRESTALNPDLYRAARRFIKAKYESGPITYEGHDYVLDEICIEDGVAQISGRFGLYYDNILTQYAIEWELRRALTSLAVGDLDSLSEGGSLPIREAIEALADPLLSGKGRCAAITVSTMVIFARRSKPGYWTFIRRRSRDVGVSTDMFHVAPSGMFEADNTFDDWSVELNVWRELSEELFNEAESHGSVGHTIRDHLLEIQPIKVLMPGIDSGDVRLVVTGITNDLLNLRTEINTVLFVSSPFLTELRNLRFNWEYEDANPKSVDLLNIAEIEPFVRNQSALFVPTAAATLALGLDWFARAI